MLKNVLTGLLILVVAVFVLIGYNGYSAKRRVITDDVYAAGASVAAMPTPVVQDAAAPAGTTQGARQTAISGETAMHADGAPSTDSLPAQPAEGEKFGTGGRFQLYRQGDMTWRLNVETGESCILLATDEEWHKERVYRSGCNGRS